MALPDKQTGIRQKFTFRSIESRTTSERLPEADKRPGRIEVSLRERNNPDHVLIVVTYCRSHWMQRYDFALDVPARQLAHSSRGFVIAAVTRRAC